MDPQLDPFVGRRNGVPSASNVVAPKRPGRPEVIAVALVALVVCGTMGWWWFSNLTQAPDQSDTSEHGGQLIAAVYDPPSNAIEAALNHGDGQIFAALATDPVALRPELIRGGPEEEAYRYQRPAYGWLGWAASGGRHDGVAWGLIAVTAVAGALLVAAGATFLVRRSVDPRWALLLLLCPGVVIDMTWVGPETLGVALLVFGLARWPLTRADSEASGPRPDWLAIACFAMAGLCRETLLIVPFVLMVTELYRRRIGWAVGAACSAVPYVAWVLYLYVRIGAWPKGSVGGRLSILPFGGMASASSGWGNGDTFVAVLIVGLAVIALAIDRRSGLRPLIAVNLLFAGLLGEAVWNRFPDYSRVLLPLTVFSMLAIASTRFAKAATEPMADQVAADSSSDDVDALMIADHA